MAVVIDLPRSELDDVIKGMGDSPLVDVRILVSIVLRKHPSGGPLMSICWHRIVGLREV